MGFQCDDTDKALLDKVVSAEEVQKVLFKMANNKLPGPDGFTCEFFLKLAGILLERTLLSQSNLSLIRVFSLKGLTQLSLFSSQERSSYSHERLPAYIIL